MLSERAASFASSLAYKGELSSPFVLRGRGGAAPGEGKFCELTMIVDSGIITTVRFQTNGCPSSVAAGSALCALIERRELSRAQTLTSEELIRFVGGLPEGTEDAADRAIQALHSITEEDSSGK